MGIGVYARWAGRTEEERRAQFTGFCTESGHLGYLREAYHGGPYATRVLVPEGFDSPEGWDWDAAEWPGFLIPAAMLRARLPLAVVAALVREAEVYHDAGARAALLEVGIEPRLAYSKLTHGDLDLKEALREIFEVQVPSLQAEQDLPDVRLTDEQLAGLIEVSGMTRSLRDFVELAERKEAEVGFPIAVYVSY